MGTPTAPPLRLYDPATGREWLSDDASWLADAETGIASAQLLDVSNFQGPFNWGPYHSVLSGGIYKMTEGLTFTDADAQHNHDSIRAVAGWQHGAYHFLRPELDGAAQAQFFIAQHRKTGLTDTDMLFLDNEVGDGRTAAGVAACAHAFMSELTRIAPHNPKGVYTMISFATGGENAGLGHWPLWLAFPSLTAPVPPPPWARWTFWQWGTRNGVDADAFNGTRTQLADWVASFAPQPVPATGSGPQRHTLADGQTLAEAASARNTTAAHLRDVTRANLTEADISQGGIYYTTH